MQDNIPILFKKSPVHESHVIGQARVGNSMHAALRTLRMLGVAKQCDVFVINPGKDTVKISPDNFKARILGDTDQIVLVGRPEGVELGAAILISVLISVATAYLFRPNIPNQPNIDTDGQDNTLYTFGGRSNYPRAYDPIPVPLGRVLTQARYIAQVAGEVVPDDKADYIRFISTFGPGQLSFGASEDDIYQNIKIGGVPVSELDDASFEYHDGRPLAPNEDKYRPQEFTRLVRSEGINAEFNGTENVVRWNEATGVTTGQWVTHTTGDRAIKARFDFQFPSGLYHTESNGNLKHLKVGFRVEYARAEAGGGAPADTIPNPAAGQEGHRPGVSIGSPVHNPAWMFIPDIGETGQGEVWETYTYTEYVGGGGGRDNGETRVAVRRTGRRRVKVYSESFTDNGVIYVQRRLREPFFWTLSIDLRARIFRNSDETVWRRAIPSDASPRVTSGPNAETEDQYHDRALREGEPGRFFVRIARTAPAAQEQGDVDQCRLIRFVALEEDGDVHNLQPHYSIFEGEVKANARISGSLPAVTAVVQRQIPVYPYWDGKGGETARPRYYFYKQPVRNGVVREVRGRSLTEYGADNQPAAEVYTSNPAWIYLACLRGINGENNVHLRDIDLRAFQKWADFCDNLTSATQAQISADTTGKLPYKAEYNGVVERKATLDSILRDVSAAGFGAPMMRGALHSIFVEAIHKEPIGLMTPATTRGMNAVRDFPEEVHGFRVQYLEPDAEWKSRQVIAYADGYGPRASATEYTDAVTGVTYPARTKQATIIKEINAVKIGCASRDMAWRIGRYRAADIATHVESFEIEASLDSIYYEVGDVINFASDIIKVGEVYGRVMTASLAGSTVTLTLNNSKEVTARPMRIEGVKGAFYEGTVTITSAGTVTLSSIKKNGMALTPVTAADAAQMVGAEFTIGDATADTDDVIQVVIKSITDRGRGRAQIVMQPYVGAALLDAFTGTVPARPVELASDTEVPPRPKVSGYSVAPNEQRAATSIITLFLDADIPVRDNDNTITFTFTEIILDGADRTFTSISGNVAQLRSEAIPDGFLQDGDMFTYRVHYISRNGIAGPTAEARCLVNRSAGNTPVSSCKNVRLSEIETS